MVISESFNRIENRIWEDVKNYEGCYKISNFGEVKSLERITRNGVVNGVDTYMTNKEKIIKNHLTKNGYYMCVLSKNNISKNMYIHSLLAVAFLGHVICGFDKVINHIDGNKQNNDLSNLEIVTARYNASDIRNRGDVSSKYTGVSWNKHNENYEARIRIGKHKVFLGCGIDQEYLGDLYEKALLNLHMYNGSYKEFREYVKSLI